MPYTTVAVTDPKRIAQVLLAWLDAPEEEEVEADEGGFDIDPYDDAREWRES